MLHSILTRPLDRQSCGLGVACVDQQSPDPGLRESAHIIMQRLAFSVATKLTQDLPSVYKLCQDGMTVTRPLLSYTCTMHFRD